eukprot:2654548-Rhodomonas_salina.1
MPVCQSRLRNLKSRRSGAVKSKCPSSSSNARDHLCDSSLSLFCSRNAAHVFVFDFRVAVPWPTRARCECERRGRWRAASPQVSLSLAPNPLPTLAIGS